MKHYNLFSILLIFCWSVFLVTCNKKNEGPCIHDEAALYVKVYDNNGILLSNATISVFDTKENFDLAKAAVNDTSLAKYYAITVPVVPTELLVDPYVEQWILVTYYDSIQSTYLSSQSYIEVLEPLQSCSDYHISVTLDKVGGAVTFWTSSTQNIPVVVKFNNITDTLATSASTVPLNPGNPNALSFFVPSGTYQYQATSADGCSWQGEVFVGDGEFKPIELAPCPRALVAFYYNTISNIPTDRKTVSIFIDNHPTPVGTLTAEYTGAIPSTSCNVPPAANILYVYVEPGVAHTYKASTGPGGTGTPCVWTGSIPPLSTDCNLNAPIYIGQGCF